MFTSIYVTPFAPELALPRSPAPPGPVPISALDFHVLLVLAAGDLYGYAIMKAVEAHSRGAVAPEIGSLYRVLARLMNDGWVAEAAAPEGTRDAHPGRARRYYRITPAGRAALRAEAERLRHALRLARDVLPEGGG
jgi:DNA-binding PadR family transcriptional regulator